MKYQPSALGDWGSMLDTATIKTGTEKWETSDGCKLFVRSWQTKSTNILLVLHGLGAHSGWFIDMGNEIASGGITVYTVDHRGFGRSEGLAGHIDNHQMYIADVAFVVAEIHKRHPQAQLYLLGHSMGGIFAAHFAAKYGDQLSGLLFLNPWVQDSTRIPLGTTLAIFTGGIFRSRRSWRVGGGHAVMTSNVEAVCMLNEDPYWRRAHTATFLVQILVMRLAILKKATQITVPVLVMQAAADKSVIPAATRKLYETLASSDKTWIAYPDYGHDSELEDNHSLLDNDIVNWIKQHTGQP